MELLEKWREIAYSETANKGDLQRLWSAYFQKEKDIYADLLKNPDEEVKGTVKELAEKYELRLLDFNYESLDGFDKSLAAYIDCEGHLNGEAAIEFSKRLGEYLTSEKKMP